MLSDNLSPKHWTLGFLPPKHLYVSEKPFSWPTSILPSLQNIGHWKNSLPYIFRLTLGNIFQKVTKDWEQKCVCLIWDLVIPFGDNIFSERKQFNQRKDFLSTNNNLFTSVSSLKCSTILKSPQNCISNIQREIWWPKNN